MTDLTVVEDEAQGLSKNGKPLTFGKLFTASDVALALGCSPDLIRRAMRTGELPYIQTGSRRKMTEKMLEDVVAAGGFGAAA